jgi:hypothetical protein
VIIKESAGTVLAFPKTKGRGRGSRKDDPSFAAIRTRLANCLPAIQLESPYPDQPISSADDLPRIVIPKTGCRQGQRNSRPHQCNVPITAARLQVVMQKVYVASRVCKAEPGQLPSAAERMPMVRAPRIQRQPKTSPNPDRPARWESRNRRRPAIRR